MGALAWGLGEVVATPRPAQPWGPAGQRVPMLRGTWVLWEMPGIDASLAAPCGCCCRECRNSRQGWSFLLLGKHRSIIVCGWESGGGEQRCSLAQRSFPPAGPGSSRRLSCSRGWIIPAWQAALFYFADEKASLDLKHL